jgi:hypothetical protein
MKRTILLGLFCLVLTLPLAAQTPIPIQNPSFESPVTWGAALGLSAWEFGNVPGWTLASGSNGGVQSLSANYFTAYPNGKQGLFLNIGSIAQDLGIPAQPNTTYLLSFYVGNRLDNFNGIAIAQLLIGSTPLCSLNVTESTIPAGTYTLSTLNCTTGATVPAGDLIILLSNSGLQANFDAISLTSSPTVAHSVTLIWKDLLNPTGTKYNIYRAPGGCPTTFAKSLLVGGVTALTYTDLTAVTGSQNYCYGVTAVSGTVESTPALTIYVPAPPTNLVAQ